MTIENRIETIAEFLSGVGVAHAFGICGSGPSLTLIGALDKRGITYINASHEASAAMMAGAATRVSGVPALSISIKGPGLVNAVAGISYNHFEDTPSIVFRSLMVQTLLHGECTSVLINLVYSHQS